MWDIVENQFDSLKHVGLLEIANLPLNESKFKRFIFNVFFKINEKVFEFYIFYMSIHIFFFCEIFY